MRSALAIAPPVPNRLERVLVWLMAWYDAGEARARAERSEAVIARAIASRRRAERLRADYQAQDLRLRARRLGRR